MSDPFGRALHDYSHDEQDTPLVQRDGEETLQHPIERFYFGEFSDEETSGQWLDSWIDGPLLDIGAGAGRDTLYFQEQYETIAIEVSEHLVRTMRERGVDDARLVDMFALRETFERDRFQSALAIGTQLGLVGSIAGLRQFFSDLAHVTTEDATAVFDCYDPACNETASLLGYRDDPTPGLAHRVMHFEYEGDVGETLLFRLFSPDRLREAAVGTGWEVADIRYDSDENVYYRAALRKR
jgi:SAM-dependent methyltransferase